MMGLIWLDGGYFTKLYGSNKEKDYGSWCALNRGWSTLKRGYGA